MGLADRDYMHDGGTGFRFTLTNKLLIALVIVYLAQLVLTYFLRVPVAYWLGLSLDGIKHWRLWQFVTFQFLHATPAPWHLLLNGMALYFFGNAIEEIFGGKRYLTFYLASGICGALLQLLVVWIFNMRQDIPMVGASAGVSALIAAFCSMFPTREMCAMIYFFPVQIKAKYFLIFLLALSVLGTVFPFDTVAHAAHLGGLLAGIAWVKLGWHRDFVELPWEGWFRRRESKTSRPMRNRPTATGKAKTASGVGQDSGDVFLSREVDPILDKISAHGIQSLTEQERQILEAARKKMDRR